MATIKSFSDLQQSKILAEILPLESADMSWVSNGLGKPFARTIPIKEDPEELCVCWSLAALLDVFPEGTDIVKDKADTENEKYMCTVGVKDDIISTFGNNPIDACYKMILKLHELKML